MAEGVKGELTRMDNPYKYNPSITLEKKEPTIEDMITSFAEDLRDATHMENQYSEYIKKYNLTSKSITVRGVSWDEVVSIYFASINKLWNTISLPKEVITYDLLYNMFCMNVYDITKEKLFTEVFRLANYEIPKEYPQFFGPDRVIEALEYKCKNFLKPLYNIRELISQGLETDPDKLKLLVSEGSEVRKKFNLGEKFSGKKNRKDEIEVFELILSEYEKMQSKGYKLSYRQICDKYAEEVFNYTNYYDLNRFYDRFLTYKNRKK